MFERNLARLEALEPLVNKVNREDITSLCAFLYDRITHPDSYVVFLGETCSGKSSIINGFLNDDILPVKAYTSTATITEVELMEYPTEDRYLAIFNNATAEQIDKNRFLELCEKPCNNLNRVKLSKYLPKGRIPGLRLFDTPGYASLVSEHDEVLKEFLPNSDIVVYVINYRTGIQVQRGGIQDEDFAFLGMLKELVREDTEILLLINRCPLELLEEDRRVAEIKEYAENLLGFAPMCFTVSDSIPQEGRKHALPQSQELWDYIRCILDSEKRIKKIEAAFDEYTLELYQKCDSIIHARYASALLSDKEHNEIIVSQKEYAERIRSTVNKYIVPTFGKLNEEIPELFFKASVEINDALDKAITESSIIDGTEMVAYTNAHLLPYTISQATKDIVMDHIETIIWDLNSKVDDFIQKEIINFSNEITIRLNSNLDVASKTVASKIIQELSKNELGKYFIQYGGIGGANAGIANAASHALKKVGDVFGKRFPLETHNALKHFLKKIGATSMKAVAMAVAVIAEALEIIIKTTTWKPILKHKVRKGVERWAKEAINDAQKDLIKLKESNVETVLEIANDIENSFEEDISHEADKYLAQIQLSEQLGKLFN